MSTRSTGYRPRNRTISYDEAEPAKVKIDMVIAEHAAHTVHTDLARALIVEGLLRLTRLLVRKDDER